MPFTIEQFVSRIEKAANRADKTRLSSKKKRKKKKPDGYKCRYTTDTSGEWKWVCGPGGQPGDSASPSDAPAADAGMSAGDGAVGGDGGGDGGGGGE
tara:strand:+ start:524 stop:814 length:291 start_codon:yes stop_codon:yes gene_type:complete